MARNRRNKPSKSTRNDAKTRPNLNLDTPGSSGGSAGPAGNPVLPLDPSDLGWLEIDTMDCVDDLELHEKCTRVIQLTRNLGLDFGMFVWAVNFGNHASRTPQDMQTARSQFRGSYLIPTLQNLRIPPRTLAKGKAPPNACGEIDAYAHALVGHQFRGEMRTFERSYGSICSKDLSEETLLGIVLQNEEEEACNCAPSLFRTLWMLGTTRYQRRHWERNKKQPSLVSLIASVWQ